MRSIYGLWGHLEKELKKHLNGMDITESLGARLICEVELGLYLLSQIAPDAPARALWVLLTGYEFPLPELQSLRKTKRLKYPREHSIFQTPMDAASLDT
jgi:hypothetical protein